MDGLFATPTIRASNPLEASLAAEEAADESTPRPSPAPFIAPSSPPTSPRLPSSRRPTSPPLSPRTAAAKARMPVPVRARSPPARVGRNVGTLGGETPSSPPPPPRPSPRPHPQSQHSQHSQPSPTAEDLSSFASLCHSLYYLKDPTSARQVDSILLKLPPSFRTAYAREMARVRAEFHRDEERRRRDLVEKVLQETIPGGTVKRALQISPESNSTAALRSSRARQLRGEALKQFLAAHCVPGLVGSHPFMRSLYAALYLQGLDTGKGGAGGRCVEWEVDVAVFAEGGTGEGWAREAVEVLKGVLGMTDRPTEPSHTDSSSTRTSHYATITTASRASSIAEAQHAGRPSVTVTAPSLVDEHGVLPPLSSSSPNGQASTHSKRPAPPVPPHRGSSASRTRSKSDPFLTPEEKAASKQQQQQQQQGGPSPSSSPSDSPAPPSPDLSSTATPTLDEATPFLPTTSTPLPSPSPSQPQPSSPPSPSTALPPPLKPSHLTFTLPPYLTDPELLSLCRLFPSFISSPTRPAARFRSNSASRAAQLKAAEEGKAEGAGEGRGGAGTERVGHGELRIGKKERDGGWRGGWWERWVGWWRGLFGIA